MRHHRRLEWIKGYDLEIYYHPRKANIVTDALNWKSYCNSSVATKQLPKLPKEFEKLMTVVTYTLEEKRRETRGSCKEI
jgi:hypothetical protein